jgi:hypothetical protein
MRPYRQLRQYRNDLSLQEYWLTTAPSATTDHGPFNLGDVVWNDTPSANGVFGWICTTPGPDGSTAVFSPIGFIGPDAAFSADAHTAGFTATAAEVSGGSASVDLALTGTLAGAANITLPTVASLVTQLGSVWVGQAYRFRIINESSGAYAWTVVTNTGWTLTGTMTVAQNTWREFVVTFTSLTAATLQSVAVGTYS